MTQIVPLHVPVRWTRDYTGSSGTDLTPRKPSRGTVADALRNGAWATERGTARVHVCIDGGPFDGARLWLDPGGHVTTECGETNEHQRLQAELDDALYDHDDSRIDLLTRALDASRTMTLDDAYLIIDQDGN